MLIPQHVSLNLHRFNKNKWNDRKTIDEYRKYLKSSDAASNSRALKSFDWKMPRERVSLHCSSHTTQHVWKSLENDACGLRELREPSHQHQATLLLPLLLYELTIKTRKSEKVLYESYELILAGKRRKM